MKTLYKLYLIIPVLFAGIVCQAQIGERTITYTDAARNRTLITELWYPTLQQVAQQQSAGLAVVPATVREASLTAGKRYPLVMLSHGTGGDRFSLMWLSAKLAAEGYIVAAVNHWGNTWDNKTPEGFLRMWERPADIRYVLTQLLADKAFGPQIDDKRVAAIGFSLGGYTVLTLAGGRLDFAKLTNFITTLDGVKETTVPEFPGLRDYFFKQDYKMQYEAVATTLADRRIRCVVAMAPALGQGFDPKSLNEVRIPTLIVGASADSIAPVRTNAAYIKSQMPKAQYVALEPAVGHYVFLNTCTPLGVQELPPFLCQDTAPTNRDDIHQQVFDRVRTFLKQTL